MEQKRKSQTIDKLDQQTYIIQLEILFLENLRESGGKETKTFSDRTVFLQESK